MTWHSQIKIYVQRLNPYVVFKHYACFRIRLISWNGKLSRPFGHKFTLVGRILSLISLIFFPELIEEGVWSWIKNIIFAGNISSSQSFQKDSLIFIWVKWIFHCINFVIGAKFVTACCIFLIQEIFSLKARRFLLIENFVKLINISFVCRLSPVFVNNYLVMTRRLHLRTWFLIFD